MDVHTMHASLDRVCCSYEVCELNSSEDRTADKILGALRRTKYDSGLMRVFATSTTGKPANARPTILLLDEVDGADRRAVEALAGALDEKDKNGKPVITRPVICTCNHPWTSTLRPIMSKARHFSVSLDTPRTARRLMQICEKEGLRADLSFCTKLLEVEEYDLRLSVNTLQLLAVQKRAVGMDLKFDKSDLEALVEVKDSERDQMELLRIALNMIPGLSSLPPAAGPGVNTGPSLRDALKVAAAFESDQLLFNQQLSLFYENMNEVVAEAYRPALAAIYLDHLVEVDASYNSRTVASSSSLHLAALACYAKLHCTAAISINHSHRRKILRPYHSSAEALATRVTQAKRAIIRSVQDSAPHPLLRMLWSSNSFPSQQLPRLVNMCRPALLHSQYSTGTNSTASYRSNKPNDKPGSTGDDYRLYADLHSVPGVFAAFGSLPSSSVAVCHHTIGLLCTYGVDFTRTGLQQQLFSLHSRAVPHMAKKWNAMVEDQRSATPVLSYEPQIDALHFDIFAGFFGFAGADTGDRSTTGDVAVNGLHGVHGFEKECQFLSLQRRLKCDTFTGHMKDTLSHYMLLEQQIQSSPAKMLHRTPWDTSHASIVVVNDGSKHGAVPQPTKNSEYAHSKFRSLQSLIGVCNDVKSAIQKHEANTDTFSKSADTFSKSTDIRNDTVTTTSEPGSKMSLMFVYEDGNSRAARWPVFIQDIIKPML
eukprot:Lankesteria_metandrocarpae@DN4024_c0_g1_i1.p1